MLRVQRHYGKVLKSPAVIDDSARVDVTYLTTTIRTRVGPSKARNECRALLRARLSAGTVGSAREHFENLLLDKKS